MSTATKAHEEGPMFLAELFGVQCIEPAGIFHCHTGSVTQQFCHSLCMAHRCCSDQCRLSPSSIPRTGCQRQRT